jgi:hypothetical protein
MRRTIFVVSVLLAALACPPASRAQDNNTQSAAKPAEPPHFYHLKLVVQELDADGKITNSRSYSTTISTDRQLGPVSIRTESNVPGPNTPGALRTIHIDAKFDINNNVHEYGRQLSFRIESVVDSYVPTDNGAPNPISRHNEWGAPVLIPIDKPTVIFTSDALDSKGAMQVVATATPIPE